MEPDDAAERFAELPPLTKNIAYQPEQMVGCPNCARMNPPHRPQCFYCGAALELTAAQSQSIKIGRRKLESWEDGFNVIFQTAAKIDNQTHSIEAARLLKLEDEVWQKLISNRTPLPLARVETLAEAELIQARLREFGFETHLVGDQALKLEQSPERLRGIEFFDEKLILRPFNRDEIVEVAPENLLLIVTGVIFERKIAAIEEHGKKADGKILEVSETGSDELLIDLYEQTNDFGYRIFAKGFDFSSLESEKELLAANNLKKLIAKLRRIAPNVAYADDYLPNRSVLAAVWEVEHKKDSQGLKREKFGKFNLKNTTTISNLAQFTKYSRLRRHLL